MDNNTKGIHQKYSDFTLSKLDPNNFANSSQAAQGNFHTIAFITEGNGVINIDFDEHIAIKNKVFFIEKHKIWYWLKVNHIKGYLIQFNDSFYNTIYTGHPKIKSDQTLVGDIPPFIRIEKKDEKVWFHIFKALIKEHKNSEEGTREILCMSLKILILMYRRRIINNSKPIYGNRKKNLLNEFQKLVNNKFIKLRKPKDYANELNVTPNYLNSICKNYYNKTLSEIIKERVILESKRLLSHTDLSVAEVSFKLGFSDNSYFGRYFKKSIGLPPEKYRNIYSKSQTVTNL